MSPFHALCFSLGFLTLNVGLSGLPALSPLLALPLGEYPPLLAADRPPLLILFELNPGPFLSFFPVLNLPSRADFGRSPLVFWERAGVAKINKRIMIQANRRGLMLGLVIFRVKTFKKLY